ncbi:MAG: hypothetical protein IKU10_04370 [Clostridia bacterium]|nr:hypothetical protein [Clostridia bacterium]
MVYCPICENEKPKEQENCPDCKEQDVAVQAFICRCNRVFHFTIATALVLSTAIFLLVCVVNEWCPSLFEIQILGSMILTLVSLGMSIAAFVWSRGIRVAPVVLHSNPLLQKAMKQRRTVLWLRWVLLLVSVHMVFVWIFLIALAMAIASIMQEAIPAIIDEVVNEFAEFYEFWQETPKG